MKAITITRTYKFSATCVLPKLYNSLEECIEETNAELSKRPFPYSYKYDSKGVAYDGDILCRMKAWPVEVK